MTVALPAAQAVLAQVAVGLPDTQVSLVDPGEKRALKESIWMAQARSEFEFRSIGAVATHGSRNRTETVLMTVKVHVYREAPTAPSAGNSALTRAYEIVDSIEAAILALGFEPAGTTNSLVSAFTAIPVPADKGWAVDGTAEITFKNYPV